MTELEKIYELQARIMNMKEKMSEETKMFTLDLLKLFMDKCDSSEKKCRDALYDIYDYVVTNM